MVERLSLPPAAHFLRGSGLVITTVHATTLQGPNTQRGEWVAAERAVAQASAQLQCLPLVCPSEELIADLPTAYTGSAALPSDTHTGHTCRQTSSGALCWEAS